MGEFRDFNDPKYKAWRKKVFSRDRFRCRMPGCAGADKTLNAHHIKRWASHPLLRYELSNGITLCRACHERVKGVEEDFESTFSAIANRDSGDVTLKLLAMRYAVKEEDA